MSDTIFASSILYFSHHFYHLMKTYKRHSVLFGDRQLSHFCSGPVTNKKSKGVLFIWAFALTSSKQNKIFTLKMEAAMSSETLVSYHIITWHHSQHHNLKMEAAGSSKTLVSY